ncbi:Vesicle transport through interaction with t-SNAREs -like protein 1B [Sarcoptes scabiei]|uniref:Vesicle transport through interaction with t-SNAREs -like protein 1B n=1 Tax=Sarcoptes scabiei TaxID=52283 RepID=A0A834RGP3_SARSC|nr:Vesicle transport through interaction with t-SNAREs -like protein 1B [Sarcoptes scabiei]
MSTFARFNDLNDDLDRLREQINLHLSKSSKKSDILTINKLLNKSENIKTMLQAEVIKCLPSYQAQMKARFDAIIRDWEQFKMSIADSIGQKDNLIASFGAMDQSYRPQRRELASGIETLERSSNSLRRAEVVARESEEIGTDIMDELANQRESLIRSREMLGNHQSSLRQSHRLIRSINIQLITNKCLLILIILLELLILVIIIVFRFILHH